MTSDIVSTYELSAGESPTEGVVQALADAADTQPLELEPLYHVLDPDALDSLFTSPSPLGGSNEFVTFEYGEYTVTFFAEGRVSVASSNSAGHHSRTRNTLDRAE